MIFLGQNKHYQFHSIELNKTPSDEIQSIISACKEVEERVWKPQVRFEEYLQNQTALFYATRDSKLVGFALFNVVLQDNTLVVTANECMVLPEDQGRGLPNLFLCIFVAHLRMFRKCRFHRLPYRNVIFVSLTVNFKLMTAFKRYSFITHSNSFFPTESIRKVALEYLREEGLVSLNEENPFFPKEAFPNSLKDKPEIKPPSFLPNEFNLHRGDGFLYVCSISNLWLLALVSWIIRIRTGFRFHPGVQRTIRVKSKSVFDKILYT